MSTPQTFESDGRAIPFLEEGEGPVRVVLLPALGLGISSFVTLAHVLEEEGFHVLRVGVRQAQTENISLHDLAQDVVDVMEHTGFRSAWIVGHGVGGAIARIVAADHPRRIEGVGLIGIESADDRDADVAAALQTAISSVDEADVLEAASVLGGDADPIFARNVLLRHRDSAAATVQAAALAATPTDEWTTLTQNFAVLAVQGAADRINVPETAAALQASAPQRVSLTTVPGAGYLGILTHAGEVGFAIEDYLAWD